MMCRGYGADYPTYPNADDACASSQGVGGHPHLPLVLGEQQPLSFQVSLEKNGAETFGLAHVPMEDDTCTLLIVDVRDESPIGAWNSRQAQSGFPEHVVKPGDRITAVSGVCADLDRMRADLRQECVAFSIERWPDCFAV